ncbi:HNH endonuclease [Mycolicibacterium sp. OfavD-34-C]|nr:HNH endonuclease signature motif containing protein [Mycolicibacterium sp. OfavD-34-C]MCG7582199.1 HNH endonuclease [Mycolicibacterium sp. OfavD-34-C]
MEALLVIGFLALAGWGSYLIGRYILKERYFASEEFSAHKYRIASFVAEHNELAHYVAEIRSRGTFALGASSTGSQAHLASFQNTSYWNYRRDRNVADYHAPNVHNCSLQVVRNASVEPLKYVMKYFNIKADETHLAEVEKLGDDIARLQEAVRNLQKREASITQSIDPPAFILKHYAGEFMEHVGVELSPITVPYPVYIFEYVSAGGNSSQRSTVTFDTATIDTLVETLSQKIRWRKSAAGQRALMTSKLRNSIKARDKHTCRYCSVSLAEQPHLLLEVDHIIPVSRGGLSTPDNLQTLCWRCNRTKSNKVASNGQIPAVPQANTQPKARSIEAPAAEYSTVRCFKCEHKQKVSKSLINFACEQCGQRLKRRVSVSAVPQANAQPVARPTDPTAAEYSTVECFKCEHKQTVSKSLTNFACEQCGQRLKRRVSVSAVPQANAQPVARPTDPTAAEFSTVECFKCEHKNKVSKSLTSFTCEQCGQRLKRRISVSDLPPRGVG